MLPEVGTDELRRLLDTAHVTVVEALGPMYFADAHIPGAVNLPPDQVAARASTLLPDRSAHVVVYGSGGSGPDPAVAVARQLIRMGYHRVATYPPGKLGWVEAGCAVSRH